MEAPKSKKTEMLFIFFNPCAAKEMKCKLSDLASYSLASVCSRFGVKTGGMRRLFRWYRVKKKKKKKVHELKIGIFCNLWRACLGKLKNLGHIFLSTDFFILVAWSSSCHSRRYFKYCKYHLQISLVSHNSVKEKMGNYWLAIKTARAAENIWMKHSSSNEI